MVYWYYISGRREELLDLRKPIDKDYEKGQLSPSQFLALKNMIFALGNSLKGEC